MELIDQVVSLELAKRLKELGFKQESLFYWNLSNQKGRIWQSNFSMRQYGIDDVIDREIKEGLVVSAYTAAELWSLLPLFLEDGGERGRLVIEKGISEDSIVGYTSDMHGRQNSRDNNLANAMAKELIYLKEIK